MVNQLVDELKRHLKSPILQEKVNTGFLIRIAEGRLTQNENNESHICIYFAAYDPVVRQVFIGHHKKSGLWLFNGGHIETGETLLEALEREMKEEWGSVEKHANIPSLLTITKIKPIPNQKCVWHFDVWYFIEINKNKFLPKKENLETEFIEMKWLSIHEAIEYVNDPNTMSVLKIIKQRFELN